MGIPDIVVSEAQRQGVDPALALEVASAESSFNPAAVSSAGAIGVMQLMPGTANQLGVNPYDAQQNIQGGVSYLRQLLSQFGDPVAAVAAYNCGPGCVSNLQSQYGSNWLAHAPAETQNYVSKVLGNVASQYTPSFSPVASSLMTSGATMTLPLATALLPAAPSTGIWNTMLVAVAVILGLGYILEET
jgi:membrane-bound lytic murein transglycosylase B